jgi:hypothetical protein
MEASLVDLFSEFTLPLVQLTYIVSIELNKLKAISLEAQS